jgi:hypothetical protein
MITDRGAGRSEIDALRPAPVIIVLITTAASPMIVNSGAQPSEINRHSPAPVIMDPAPAADRAT